MSFNKYKFNYTYGNKTTFDLKNNFMLRNTEYNVDEEELNLDTILNNNNNKNLDYLINKNLNFLSINNISTNFYNDNYTEYDGPLDEETIFDSN